MSTITTKQDQQTLPHPIDPTYVKTRKTMTQEEKSRTETQQQTHKVITGTLDELAPYMEGLQAPRETTPSARETRTSGVYSTTSSTARSPPYGEKPPIGAKPVPVAATETRKVAYTTGGVPSSTGKGYTSPPVPSSQPPPPPSQFANEYSPGMSSPSTSPVLGDIISSSTTSSKTRTVETVTYKMEKDGVVETRVEQKITIQSDGDPIDHDKALADAIQEATMMNPDMTVEKIEIQQQSTIH